MIDPFLRPYLPAINRRNHYIYTKERLITDSGKISLYDLADYHIFFGLHQLPDEGGWIFREWAPNATALYIIGMMTDWKIDQRFRLFKRESEPDSGIWERSFSKDTFMHNDIYRLKMFWNGGEGDRIPSCAARVVQDPQTLIFNAQVWSPQISYKWESRDGLNKTLGADSESDSQDEEPLLIYEAHTGMAQEQGRVGTFRQFEENILPHIKDAGYNAIQLMAVQEHPYYGSFGYHVSSFFAPSSRFGTPHDFKSLVDAAHRAGIKVIMDIVHSHSVSNEVEGLSCFDGTLTQFFHGGERGVHKLWGSRCFDYSRDMVIRFLLSNCRYWIEEFHVDGFRFDGITSMLYRDHGIGRAFTGYGDYFLEDGDDGDSKFDLHSSWDVQKGGNVDLDALCYLYLANRLIHDILPDAITIAEDVSGYPGLAAPQTFAAAEYRGGIGFDYRFAMGISDFWIKLLKEYQDEKWPMGKLWYELNARRDDEKTISYAECHDQALVGDQTLMMRLMGESIYTAMSIEYETPATFRGVALHKMIRLITLATAGGGYLNFMGNEFGHPEWIDFPGAHNSWSYHFARRQWSLMENEELYFYLLAQFDKEMVELAKSYPSMGLEKAELLHIHEDNKVIAFKRRVRPDKRRVRSESTPKRENRNMIFIFNFNPLRSFQDYMIDAPPGKYQEVMNSDEIRYGGKGRLVSRQEHFTHYIDDGVSAALNRLSLYLPARSATVLLEDLV